MNWHKYNLIISSSGMLLMTNGLQWRDTFSLLRVMMRTRGVVIGGMMYMLDDSLEE